jgi:hypothetical protein
MLLTQLLSNPKDKNTNKAIIMAHHRRKFSFCCSVRCDASWHEQRSFFLDDSARVDISHHVAVFVHNFTTGINPFNLFLLFKNTNLLP